MKKNIMITPEGTRDFLFEECTAGRSVQKIIEKVFKSRGFYEVITPTIEFYDIFSMDASGISQESMYTLTDHKGRILVLRPDLTLPIARMTATRLKQNPLPIRLYYNQRVFRNNPSLTGRSNEVMQSGIELLGTSGKRADLEVITTAMETLHQIVPDFRVEIGHVGFFKALASELHISNELLEEIRISIESKDYSALNNILDGLEQTEAVEALRKLPRLFGGEEVFEEAAKLNGSGSSNKALAYLKEIYQSLISMGIGNVIIDLGLVQRNDYYSDIVFSGYIEGSGDAVLSGGRYDNLLDSFGHPMPSAGFGLNVDALTKIILQKGSYEKLSPPEAVVHGDDGYEMNAILYTKKLTEKGIKCENSVYKTRKEAIENAKKRKIKEIYFISEKAERIPL